MKVEKNVDVPIEIVDLEDEDVVEEQQSQVPNDQIESNASQETNNCNVSPLDEQNGTNSSIENDVEVIAKDEPKVECELQQWICHWLNSIQTRKTIALAYKSVPKLLNHRVIKINRAHHQTFQSK